MFRYSVDDTEPRGRRHGLASTQHTARITIRRPDTGRRPPPARRDKVLARKSAAKNLFPRGPIRHHLVAQRDLRHGMLIHLEQTCPTLSGPDGGNSARDRGRALRGFSAETQESGPRAISRRWEGASCSHCRYLVNDHPNANSGIAPPRVTPSCRDTDPAFAPGVCGSRNLSTRTG